MVRWACIRVPSLALQLAVTRQVPGFDRPLAVVRDDRPASPVVQLNLVARALGLGVGMRYSEALAVVPTLKGVVVSADDRARAHHAILETLDRWSPRVERCDLDPDGFWVDPTGLTGLFGTEAQWGAGVRSALADRGFRTVIVVGQSRLGTYVLAHARRRSTVVKTAEAEARAVASAPLAVLPLGLKHRRVLARLGITTWGALAAIPADEVARRWGSALLHDVRRLKDWNTVPVQNPVPAAAVAEKVRFEPAVADTRIVVRALAEPLHRTLAALGRRGKVLAELRLVFVLETGLKTEVLRPAEPTVQPRVWDRLVGLRLAKAVWDSGVTEVRLGFRDEAPAAVLGDWFDAPVHRNPRAGAEALALVKALGGPQAVVRAVLADSHVPDLAYRWEASDALAVPRPGREREAAVRRVWWHPGAPGNPAGQRLGGPYRLQTTGTAPVDKDYWFLRGAHGEVAWVSWDRRTQQTVWEGTVD